MSYASEYNDALKKLKKKKNLTVEESSNDDYATEYHKALTELEVSTAGQTNRDENIFRAEIGSSFDDDEDIAPVREEDNSRFDFFQKGVFEDGYQFGDVTKSILGTAGDAGLGILKGAGSLVEGLSDAVEYGIAGIADLAGADETAERLRNAAKVNAVDYMTQGADDFLDKYSVLGRTSDSIMEGVGQVGTIILTGGIAAGAGLGAVGTTALTSGLMGVSGFGSGASEAYQSGATDEEAATYGLISGAADAISEMIFGGLGKGFKAVGISKGLSSADDLLAKKLSSKFSSQMAKNFTEFGIKAGAEGFEEVVAGIAQAAGKKATYMSDKDFGDILKDENLLEQFVVGAVTSGIAQSGVVPGMKSGSLIEANREGRDFISGLTQNEQSVIDKVYEETIAEKESDGKKLTAKEKNKLYDSIVEQMDKGYISTDTIESVLGGDTYKTYKDTVDSEEALKKELADLQSMEYGKMNDIQHTRLNELKGMNLGDTTKRDSLRKQLDDKISPLLKNSRLVESYNERARKGEAFKADLTKYTGKQKEAVERAINSGLLNNTNRSHELVNVLSKIEADKGIVFDYTNNERLKETGFAVEGKTVNGFEKDGTVTLNVQSAKAWQSVVGHEITHVLEGTEAYSELQKALYAYAKSKGELDSRKATLTELYKGMNADIDSELTADLVGDYLFTDSDFINRLSTENRNVFQKIYDEIKYLCKVATGKELTEIEKVKREFDNAWKELKGSNIKTDGKTKLSMSGENSKTSDTSLLSKANDMLADGIDSETIRKETGWHKGYDGKWRYEIDDSGFEFYPEGLSKNPEVLRTRELQSKWRKGEATETEFGELQSLLKKADYDELHPTTLSKMVVHKELFEAYPQLKDIKVVFLPLSEADGYYSLTDKKIVLNENLKDNEAQKETLIHEIQHAIQHIEGFAIGASVEYWQEQRQDIADTIQGARENLDLFLNDIGIKDFTKKSIQEVRNNEKTLDQHWEDLKEFKANSKYAKEIAICEAELAEFQKEYDEITKGMTAYEQYYNTAGEIEARDAENRLNLSAEERKNKRPDIDNKNVVFADLKYSVSEDSNGNELSLAVQKRFANSKAVDENGNLKVLYHGTYGGEFYTFDKAKGSVEGDFGSGFYFTDNESDVENNYEGGGADFENKVARRAEQIESEEEIDYSEAEARAREELYVGSNKHTVYLNIENPAIVGETYLFDPEKYYEEFDREDYDSEEDYDYDVEMRISEDIDQILWDIDRNVDVYSMEGLSEVLWNAVNEGGIDIEQLKAKINDLYLEDSNGNLVGNEVTRQIIESLGYDGIIDNTVSTKFNMGLEEGTTHYIVFKPNQIKSIDNQNPTDDPDIRYSLSDNTLDNKQNLVYNGERGEGYAQTDEFRNLQAECQRMSDEDIQLYHSGNKQIDDGLRERFSRSVKSIFLESKNNGISYDKGILNLTAKNNDFNMHEGVNGSLFHDVFEMSRNYLKYGELVDLHEIETTDDGIGYNDCYNYLSDDGLSGFSITPDGDLISVFNSSGKSGFLRAIAPIVKEKATTLDCYASENQNLMGMYSAIFGFKAASVMDYNMEYDHDNIAENHNKPKVAFMVNTESNVETKAFTEEQYDEAVAYRNGFVMSENIAPVKNSLSFKGEQPSSVGTPLQDLALAPVKDVAENATVDADAYYTPATAAEVEELNRESFESLTDADAPLETEQFSDRLSDSITIDKKSLKQLTKTIGDSLGLNRTARKELQQLMQDFSKNEFATKEELYEQIADRFGTQYDEIKHEYIADAKSYLRNTKVYVSPFDKGEFGGTKDYTAFMRKNFGKIRFSKDGASVDQVYRELSEVYSSLFSDDIVNPADQLRRMAEVANEPASELIPTRLPTEMLQDATDMVYDSIVEYKETERLNAAEKTQEELLNHLPDIAPLPTNTNTMPMPDEIVPMTEEEANALQDEKVKAHSATSLEAIQTELENVKELRSDAFEKYEQKIAQKQAELNSKKNKDTKVAHNLRMQIERLKRLRDSTDADYSKRIGNLETREKLVREGKPTTRQEHQNNIINDVKATFSSSGFDFDDVLSKAKNLSTFSTVDNIPQRVMEKALGYKEGQILSDLTVNKVAQNETKGIKWLNEHIKQLKQISEQYGIKPNSKQDSAAQMYAEGFYVDDNNNIVEYGDKELAADFPNADVRNRIKGLAKDQRFRQIYDETLALINESRARNAYPEIQKLDNYFLHFRAMDDTFSKLGLPFNPNDIRAKDLPTDLNGVTADLKPGQPYFASAMHRTGKRTSFALLGGIERYLTSAKNQIYHIDDIQTLRALRNYIADTYGQANGLEGIDALTEEEAQERIEQVYGSHLSTFAKFLNEEANVLAGKTALIDRGLEGIIGRRGMTFFDTLNKQVGSNMVGYNISSSFTNFIPVAQAFAKTNKFDFLKAFAQTASNKIGSIFGRTDSFAENSPVVIRRKGADRFYRTPFQKVGDAGYVLMGAFDNISTELIARTKYNELTRKGMSEQEAHFETDKWVSRLMGDRSLGQMPQLYNSKMLGIVTKFQLEVRNQLDSQFYDTIQEAKVSSEDIENGLAKNAKTAAKVTSTFVQLAAAQHLFGKAFESIAGYNPAFDIISVLATMFGFDDEEESEDTALDNVEQGFLELLEDLPYTSTFTGGRIPMSSALPISELIKGKDSYGNEKSRVETLSETIPYYVLPGGYGQIKKTTQGLGMFSDEHPVSGSYTDSGNLRFPVEDTLENKIKAGIFGQYASENAREYFDKGYAPLKEKQIQEYQDVELPIADYWDYREGLKGLKTNAEKADYINSLDIADWQKNLLINNILDRKEDVDMSNYDDFGSYEEFDYATKNPEKYAVSKVAGGYASYKEHTKAMNDIRADVDGNGKTISGSAKEKKLAYINSLDIDWYEKLILFKSEYPADDTYNAEIINYVNNHEGLTYEERISIFTELGFTVIDGQVYWD